MFPYIAYGLRVFAGLALSSILCVGAVVTVWVLFHFMDYMWPNELFIGLWFSGIGLCAGLGTVIAWLDSEVVGKLRSLSSLPWLVLGLAAAWAAYYFETVVDPNPGLFTSREITQSAILWAALVPNVIASGLGLFRQIRSGWL